MPDDRRSLDLLFLRPSSVVGHDFHFLGSPSFSDRDASLDLTRKNRSSALVRSPSGSCSRISFALRCARYLPRECRLLPEIAGRRLFERSSLFNTAAGCSPIILGL